ncbi:MAG: ferrichrome-iron receptor, partial [Verrucomicrobia bacterium]|nr:ferrichrome-iron receptor [Verrucomicrobiota bacterium]
MKPLRSFAPFFAGALLFAGTQLRAQTSAPPARDEPKPLRADEVDKIESEDVVKMDKFKVSTTIGTYHEETSAMATKIPMERKEVPSSLQILNASALADRNAVTLQDVYTYVIGMAQTQVNVNGFTFRGFPNSGGFTQNINYDGLQGPTSNRGAVSAANVERVEFLKGPNSVLYGQMNPGGLMNIVTKSPQSAPHVSVTGTYRTFAGEFDTPGDHNSYIGTFDVTGPIDEKKHWLYRVIVSGQRLESWRQGREQHSMYLYPS